MEGDVAACRCGHGECWDREVKSVVGGKKGAAVMVEVVNNTVECIGKGRDGEADAMARREGAKAGGGWCHCQGHNNTPVLWVEKGRERRRGGRRQTRERWRHCQ